MNFGGSELTKCPKGCLLNSVQQIHNQKKLNTNDWLWSQNESDTTYQLNINNSETIEPVLFMHQILFLAVDVYEQELG